ncbi:TetR family transcriptional regulator [Nigerium sp.]|uniref:TetR family transcriptional regulator n=1 Tax=Nigerium sp. TaxID=2042655 RepID=UPI0032221466
MAWDTEGTKRKILDAATAEFVARGPDGTTVEKIARAAGVNKERVYNYFGGKQGLFARVLAEQVTTASASVPIPAGSPEEVGEYAGRLFDYLTEHPQLLRLLQWEALTVPGEVTDEAKRAAMYADRSAELAHGQASGVLTDAFEASDLNILILGIVGYWGLLPQVSRMVTGSTEVDARPRRRAAVVEAARRLVTP